MPENNNEVLLKVENLCQFFKMGNGELKAAAKLPRAEP